MDKNKVFNENLIKLQLSLLKTIQETIQKLENEGVPDDLAMMIVGCAHNTAYQAVISFCQAAMTAEDYEKFLKIIQTVNQDFRRRSQFASDAIRKENQNPTFH